MPCAKSIISQNHERAFIRATRPQHGCLTGLPCPNCGSETSFLEQYNRHYCYSCGRYAPEGYGDRGAKACPTCGGILSYIVAYERYYCYHCNAYPPEGVAPEKREPEPAIIVPTVEAGATEDTIVHEPSRPEEAPPQDVETSSEEPVEPESEPTATPSPRPEESTTEEVSNEQEASPKPPLVRRSIWQAKKPMLLDLCKAYGLDSTGTKEQLRERLLSYLDELEPESKEEEEETRPEEEPVAESEEETPEEIPRVAEEPELISESPASEEPSQEQPIEAAEESPETLAPVTSAATEVILETPVAERSRPAEPVLVVQETSTVREIPKVEHPCPTCSRELTYISQYNRWYCYSCRAYSPMARSKNACPNCGATLRWIDRYERWWCDSCRRYAPADLPRPERAGMPVAATVTPERAVRPAAYQAAAVVHRHRSPGSGIGLAALGLVLFVLYEALVDLPGVLTVNTGITLTPDVAWGLRFFAFVFVAGGAILGLSSVRDRR